MLVVLALAGGCGAGHPREPVAVAVRRPVARSLEVRAGRSSPVVALVARDGDPDRALAWAVRVEGGSWATTALAAVLQQRLEASGLLDVAVVADADAVRGSLRAGEPVDAAVGALHDALARPVVAGGPEVAAAARRVAALGRVAGQGLGGDAVSSCTGQLVAPHDGAPDLSGPGGAERLEALRRGAFAASRIALAGVGPRAWVEALARTVAARAWPTLPALPGVAPTMSAALAVAPSPGLSPQGAVQVAA